MKLFQRQKNKRGKKTVPVWFMRQAGRYHQHYQNIRKRFDFMGMCKDPALAKEITLGPVEEFGFDAAILFSDLLFPLEQLGMGLEYSPGPVLKFHLKSNEELGQLAELKSSQEFYKFQGDAMRLLKREFSSGGTTLLGFVGAPFTLYTYAVEGGHKGNMVSAKRGFYDGRYDGFWERLKPLLLEEMFIQAEGGADTLCVFDTAAGELSLGDYKKFVIPLLRSLAREFRSRSPGTKLLYYSKHTHISYLQSLECSHIDVLGIDWRVNLKDALKALGKDYWIQGNLDPAHLFLPWEQLEGLWNELWQDVQSSGVSPDRWICGLGHGVLPGTPEDNVKKSVEHIHRCFEY